MAEIQVYAANPKQAAIQWVTTDKSGKSIKWTFKKWVKALKYKDYKAGMKGTLANGQDFVIREDYEPKDAKHPNPRYYHVNASKGNEHRSFQYEQVAAFSTETQAIERYKTLTENIEKLGDKDAARRFMGEF